MQRNFSCQKGKYASEQVPETKCKNKIKKARNHGISLPPKRKNAIPPTSRFKKKTAQSLEAHSNIGKTDDEIDDRSNKNDSPTRHNSNNIPFAIRSLSSPSISTRLSATGSNIGSSEVNDDSDISELSTITLQLSATSSNAIEVNRSKINNDSDISKLFTTIPCTMRSLSPSKILVRLSAKCSNAIEVNSTELRSSSFSKALVRLSATSSNVTEVDGSEINNNYSTSESPPLLLI
ncbi:45845_t:CDS:2 [Gigaspora margarita]|uniref:45845_t:CDS:1 n=1 Tax=Gigaspora margarita TaxID=4874 RepID=A0ABN7UXS6_GIGMA|nr:45845_t:CDS:2 [Gigaspora margarita]